MFKRHATWFPCQVFRCFNNRFASFVDYSFLTSQLDGRSVRPRTEMTYSAQSDTNRTITHNHTSPSDPMAMLLVLVACNTNKQENANNQT